MKLSSQQRSEPSAEIERMVYVTAGSVEGSEGSCNEAEGYFAGGWECARNSKRPKRLLAKHVAQLKKQLFTRTGSSFEQVEDLDDNSALSYR